MVDTNPEHTGLREVCESAALLDGGKGVRFPLPEHHAKATGFVIRYQDQVYAYVNQCAHVPVEMDWNEGDFFDLTKHYLICATHGAHYQPQSGYCVMGPCKGKKLISLRVLEENSKVFVDVSALFGAHNTP